MESHNKSYGHSKHPDKPKDMEETIIQMNMVESLSRIIWKVEFKTATN